MSHINQDAWKLNVSQHRQRMFTDIVDIKQKQLKTIKARPGMMEAKIGHVFTAFSSPAER